ncbi:MAG: BolA family protein [Gammaproteobacteria bacterium]
MSEAATRVVRIRTALAAAFPGATIEVVDDSHLHRGHAGAREGKGHFRVSLTSPVFDGLLPLARHRKVYAALGTLMDSDIHALSIDAKSPRERDE